MRGVGPPQSAREGAIIAARAIRGVPDRSGIGALEGGEGGERVDRVALDALPDVLCPREVLLQVPVTGQRIEAQVEFPAAEEVERPFRVLDHQRAPGALGMAGPIADTKLRGHSVHTNPPPRRRRCSCATNRLLCPLDDLQYSSAASGEQGSAPTQSRSKHRALATAT